MTAKVELLTPSGGKVILDPTDTAVDRTLTLPAVAGTVFNQGNVVGTVSESGGVPTGAIIESGSNANGKYTKYADGTLICFHAENVGAGNNTGSGTFSDPYRSPLYSWTLPTEFVENNYRVITAARATSIGADGFVIANTGTAGSRTASEVGQIQLYRGTNVSTGVVVELMAIGRWF